MRLILKERKYLKESIEAEKRQKWNVLIKPQDFLSLAEEDPSLYKRPVASKPFDKEQAGYMVLVINPNTGKILSHDGRGRALSALKSNVKEIEITLKIDEERFNDSFSWNSLPEYFLQQGHGKNFVPKSDIRPIEKNVSTDFSDFLDLKGKIKIFPLVIVNNPSGPYKMRDPSREVSSFFGVKYTEIFTPMLRKQAGMQDIPGKLPVSVYDAIEKYINAINTHYKISDEEGELKIKRLFPNGSSVGLNREPVSDVKVEQK
jgi:hypothetical protein